MEMFFWGFRLGLSFTSESVNLIESGRSVDAYDLALLINCESYKLWT